MVVNTLLKFSHSVVMSLLKRQYEYLDIIFLFCKLKLFNRIDSWCQMFCNKLSTFDTKRHLQKAKRHLKVHPSETSHIQIGIWDLIWILKSIDSFFIVLFCFISFKLVILDKTSSKSFLSHPRVNPIKLFFLFETDIFLVFLLLFLFLL